MSESQRPNHSVPYFETGDQLVRIGHTHCHPILQPGATKMLDIFQNKVYFTIDKIAGRRESRAENGLCRSMRSHAAT